MEAPRSSETMVSYRKNTRHRNPEEDLDLNLQSREDLKFRITKIMADCRENVDGSWVVSRLLTPTDKLNRLDVTLTHLTCIFRIYTVELILTISQLLRPLQANAYRATIIYP